MNRPSRNSHICPVRFRHGNVVRPRVVTHKWDASTRFDSEIECPWLLVKSYLKQSREKVDKQEWIRLIIACWYTAIYCVFFILLYFV